MSLCLELRALDQQRSGVGLAEGLAAAVVVAAALVVETGKICVFVLLPVAALAVLM